MTISRVASTIHYFDFTTNTDHVVPGNQLDLLSDIAGSRIAFTEVRADGEHVIVYDIASQASTIFPGAGKSNPSIGGNLVAFEDRSFLPGNQSEISLYDLSTGTVTRLTNDTLFDKNPLSAPLAMLWYGRNVRLTVLAVTSTLPLGLRRGSSLTEL